MTRLDSSLDINLNIGSNIHYTKWDRHRDTFKIFDITPRYPVERAVAAAAVFPDKIAPHFLVKAFAHHDAVGFRLAHEPGSEVDVAPIIIVGIGKEGNVVNVGAVVYACLAFKEKVTVGEVFEIVKGGINLQEQSVVVLVALLPPEIFVGYEKHYLIAYSFNDIFRELIQNIDKIKGIVYFFPPFLNPAVVLDLR